MDFDKVKYTFIIYFFKICIKYTKTEIYGEYIEKMRKKLVKEITNSDFFHYFGSFLITYISSAFTIESASKSGKLHSNSILSLHKQNFLIKVTKKLLALL